MSGPNKAIYGDVERYVPIHVGGLTFDVPDGIPLIRAFQYIQFELGRSTAEGARRAREVPGYPSAVARRAVPLPAVSLRHVHLACHGVAALLVDACEDILQVHAASFEATSS